MSPRFGVLALQGDYDAHAAALRRAGAFSFEVRRPSELPGLDGLVIPGGESTALLKLMDGAPWHQTIRELHDAGGVLFGTCAGAILLGHNLAPRPPSWGLLDADVERNAYGRQIDSFSKRIRLDAFARELECVFIRAPRFRRVGPGVRVLARDGGDPILLAAPGLLAATFHPELADDPLIHRHFLSPALWLTPREEVAVS